MSIGADRSVSTSSDTSEYDVSDLLSIVSCRETQCKKQCEHDKDPQHAHTHGHEHRAPITLRERRRSRVQGIPLLVCGLPNKSQMAANGNMQIQPSAIAAKKSAVWKRALTKAIASGDPWTAEGFDHLPTELATRYRFDTRNRKWVVDQVYVRMQEKPFGRGAMRQCFRLKKKSNFATRSDFSTASNCVAKSYLDPAVTRQTYFDDAYLQMDAKHWAEQFNLNDPDPPKKIDLIQVAILEFTHRPGSPLFHLEHFIEGEYTKYNSNSGFIDAHARMTPQTFSHFTFERSGRSLMVVDVQGVGDLYTDPQIHTAYTSDMYSADEAPPYGDGNLGVRGMALFFYTHRCNQICILMGLSPFAHSDYEMNNAAHRWRSLSTSCTGGSCTSPAAHSSGAESPLSATVVRQRTRTRSGGSCSSDEVPNENATSSVQTGMFPIHEDEHVDNVPKAKVRQHSSESTRTAHSSNGDDQPDEHETRARTRSRIDSQMLPEEASSILADIVDPLDADAESHPRRLSPDEILALVHLDFARCYDSGRFATVDQIMLAAAGATPIDSVVRRTADRKPVDHAKPADAPGCEVHLGRDECEAALFHLEEAAKLGNHDAIRLLSRIYLNMDRDLLNCLSEASFADAVFNLDEGLKFMRKTAEFDVDAALFLGELYETGRTAKSPLVTCVVPSNTHTAIAFYAKAQQLLEGETAEHVHAMPLYEVHAKLAVLYAGDDVRDYTQAYECYSAAAEAATASMKGKLAARYYELAEEMSALIEE